MGRKSWDKEVAMKGLWNLSIPILRKALECKDYTKISYEKQVEIAQHLTTKMFPREQKLDVTGDISLNTVSYKDTQK